MKFVVDTNILLAAFLKNATTREILLDDSFEFFAPEYLLKELNSLLKNKNIRKRLKVPDDAIQELSSLILSRIQFIPELLIKNFIEKALKLVSHPEDSPYVALSLALKIPVWSNDNALKEASKFHIKVISTKEIIQQYLK